MEEKIVSFVATGFDANAFQQETIVMEQDRYCKSYRLFIGDDQHLHVEFEIGESVALQPNETIPEKVIVHCIEHMYSIMGLAYRQAYTEGATGFELLYTQVGTKRSIYITETMNMRADARVGKKRITGLEQLSDGQRVTCKMVAHILGVNNQTLKYLLLYECLQKLCGDKQKNIEEFISSSHTAFVHSLKLDVPARKRTTTQRFQNKEETEITYLRNMLAHPDSTKVQDINVYTSARLDGMIKTIIELIYEIAER